MALPRPCHGPATALPQPCYSPDVRAKPNLTFVPRYIFFNNIPTIKQKLQTLLDVGLDYIEIGQSATTLSGGEAQRIKLSKELTKKSTGKTL